MTQIAGFVGLGQRSPDLPRRHQGQCVGFGSERINERIDGRDALIDRHHFPRLSGVDGRDQRRSRVGVRCKRAVKIDRAVGGADNTQRVVQWWLPGVQRRAEQERLSLGKASRTACARDAGITAHSTCFLRPCAIDGMGVDHARSSSLAPISALQCTQFFSILAAVATRAPGRFCRQFVPSLHFLPALAAGKRPRQHASPNPPPHRSH